MPHGRICEGKLKLTAGIDIAPDTPSPERDALLPRLVSAISYIVGLHGGVSQWIGRITYHQTQQYAMGRRV